MLTKINGLIIRDTAYGESDKMLTVLTAARGKIVITGKGVRSQKSVLRYAAHIMFYGELTLYERNDRLWLKEAAVIRDFYDVSIGLEALSLVAYIFDVMNYICVEGEDESVQLKLTLNTLHMITAGQRGLRFIKAVFEMRCAAEAGFAPMLEERCAMCGGRDAAFLDFTGGCLICAACTETSRQEVSAPLFADTLRAVRHCVTAPSSRIFAFKISEESEENFYEACERYLAAQTDRLFPTLTYLKALYDDIENKNTDTQE